MLPGWRNKIGWQESNQAHHKETSSEKAALVAHLYRLARIYASAAD